MKKLYNVLALWLLAFSVSAETQVLPVDEAFKQSTEIIGDEISVKFEIAEGYYLYRHAFNFKGINADISSADIPAGKKKTDEFFGEVETYRRQVIVTVPYLQGENQPQLEVKFQGCADAGICYPPQKRLFDLPIKAPQSSQSTASLFSGSPTSFFGGTASLPVSEAFRFEVIALSDVELSVRFTMAPHIYLYKDQLEFSTFTQGVKLGQPIYPDAQKKDDPEFGLVDVFYDVAEITLPYSRSKPLSSVDIEAAFQGCEDGKICYPPDSRLITVDVPAAKQLSDVADVKRNVDKTSGDNPMSETQQLTADISSKPVWLTLLNFLGFGLLLSLTPCVFPMIPILSSLIVGQKNPSTARAFVLSLTYVLAMALTYTLIGVVAGLAGANLQAMFQKPWIIISFSVVFVLLALSMFGFYELQLPAKWQNKLSNISNKQKGGSLLGVAVMGFLSALIVGPCVAPPLAAAVIYISTEQSGAVLGGLALFAMSMGMGVPLIAIGTSAGKWMPSSGGWMNVVKAFFGIALLGMAVWFMSRILSDNVVLYMWSTLVICSAVMWSSYAKDSGLKGAWTSFFDAIKIIGLLVGSAQLIGAMSGGSDPFRPLKGVFSVASEKTVNQMQFKKIKSLTDLQSALKASDKPVYFDFYADWCIECKRMEATTFQDVDLVALSSQVTLLKADVTANDEVDAELMSYFQIVGPPASLFFEAGGEPLVQHNFFGYKSAAELKQTFEKILN